MSENIIRFLTVTEGNIPHTRRCITCAVRGFMTSAFAGTLALYVRATAA